MNKLQKYIALSASALSTFNAKSEIVYVDVNPDINIQNDSFALDLDSNGVMDFKILHNSNSSVYSLRVYNANQIIWPQVNISTLSGNCLLNSISTISNSLQNFSSNYGWIGSDSTIYAFRPQTSFYYVGYIPMSIGYVGLRFDVSGNTHYGWLRARTSRVDYTGGIGSGSSFSKGITIYDYAYESCPDVPIVTGKTSGTYKESVETITACEEYIYDGTTYDSTQTITKIVSCDSSHLIYLEINIPSFYNQTINGCDSTLYNGITYYLDTTLTSTLLNSVNCDSIVTTNISVLKSSSSFEIIKGCTPVQLNGESYNTDTIIKTTIPNSNGCDSIITSKIITLNETYFSVDTTIGSNQIFEFNNEQFDSTGTYNIILTNIHGCDSVITLNLSVLNTLNELINVSIFPNPSNDKFHFNSDEIITDIKIINSIGKVIFKNQPNQNSTVIDLSDFDNGVYFATINNKKVVKLLKK